MSQFNLGDRSSSTVIYATDSLDEMFSVASSIIADDGVDGLDGLSLSVFDEDTDQHEDYDDMDVMLVLQSMKSKQWSDQHPRQRVPRPDRQRWLLRAIGWGQGTYPWTQIPFMKAAYLLIQSDLEFDGLDYSFRPYHFGPWDLQVIDDLDSLVAQGLLRMRPVMGTQAREYWLTDWGRQRIEATAADVDNEHRAQVVAIATRVTAKPYRTMLRDLYEEFPEIATNTVLQ